MFMCKDYFSFHYLWFLTWIFRGRISGLKDGNSVKLYIFYYAKIFISISHSHWQLAPDVKGFIGELIKEIDEPESNTMVWVLFSR